MTSHPPATLVVANHSDPDPGYVGERLEWHGHHLRRAWREDGVPLVVPEGVSCVLLLGSEWSVARPHAPQLLDDECALVRSAGERGIPVLGLCYGAQVLAHAYGGRVRTAPTPEVGLVPVETADRRLVPSGPWWQFHGDVIDVPEQATLVAHNARGAQAFTVERALGVQFHPEVRPAVLDEWLRRVPAVAAAADVPPDELAALAVTTQQHARAAAHGLVDEFLSRFAA